MIWEHVLIVFFFILLILVIAWIVTKREKDHSNSIMVVKKEYGFVMCRHVHQPEVNRYWQECVRNIRRFHPKNKIVIIDDNSNPEYLDKDYEKKLLARDPNVFVVESEYKGVGELLGYYYFHKHRWFEKAVILHDSVFVNSPLLKQKVTNVKDVAFLWSFRTKIYDDNETIDMYLNILHNHEKLVVQKKSGKWVGCFGVMMVIRLEFLDRMVKEHRIFDILLPRIKCRENRMAMERVMSIIIHTYMENNHVDSLFGDIHDYCIWGHTYSDYENKKLDALPIIKVWTGR